MEEIICSACGRPNLAEAEKCWYCQVSLSKDAVAPPKSNEAASSLEQAATPSQPEPFPSGDDQGDNIPEWLKRVRDLKKADQPVEETDQWQQDKLFTGSPEEKIRLAKQAETSSRKVNRPEKTLPEKDQKEGQPLLEAAPEIEIKDFAEEPTESPEDSLTDDGLPEGFTPFDKSE